MYQFGKDISWLATPIFPSMEQNVGSVTKQCHGSRFIKGVWEKGVTIWEYIWWMKGWIYRDQIEIGVYWIGW